MQPLTVLVLTSAVTAGVALGLFSALKQSAASRPGASSLTGLNFGLVVLLLLAALAVDALPLRTGLIGGAGLLAAGLLGLAAVPAAAHAAAVPLAVAGFGASALYLVTLQMLPAGLFGEQEVAASLLFGTVFLALGGLIARPLLDVVSGLLGRRAGLAALAAAALAPIALTALAPADGFLSQPPPSPLSVLTESRVWLAALVLAFYVPLEAFVSVWVTTYLSRPTEDGEAGPDLASSWVGWFWLTVLATRVVVGAVQHVTHVRDLWQPALLVVPALLAAVVLGNLSGSATTRQALSGLITLGIVLGPVFPVLLTAVASLPRDAGGPAVALAAVHAGGALGGAVLSPLVRLSAEAQTAQRALQIPLFMALLMTAAALLLALTGRG